MEEDNNEELELAQDETSAEGTDDDFDVVIADEAEEEAPAEEAAAEEEAPAEEAAAEEETPAEAAADDDETELAAMPEKFKKRLMREKRLRDQIIHEREQIRKAAMEVATVAQRKDEEIVTLQRQYATVQKQYAETLDYAYEQSIQNKASELRKAREDGNYDAELKAQGELDQLRFQQNQIRDAKRSLPDPESIKMPERKAEPSAPAQPQKAPVSPLAVKWIDANKTWLNSEKFAGHRAFVLAEDKKLIQEGYDPQSPEYYKEIDRRIDSAFPSLRKKPTATGKGSTPPVAAAGTTRGGSAPAKKGTVTLTKQDLANMRRFGLDITNKEHLREYARSRTA